MSKVSSGLAWKSVTIKRIDVSSYEAKRNKRNTVGDFGRLPMEITALGVDTRGADHGGLRYAYGMEHHEVWQDMSS